MVNNYIMSSNLDADVTITGRLDVSGPNSNVDAMSGGTFGGVIYSYTSGSNFVRTLKSLQLGYVTTPTNQLELSSSDARKLTTTTWLTGSDERMKNSIETANLERCIDIVSQLDLKYFKWSTPNVIEDTHSLGWIAQEVGQFFPKSIEVSEGYGISDCQNLNSDQIIKVMWGALRKLRQDLKVKYKN